MIHFNVTRMNYLSITEPSDWANSGSMAYGLSIPISDLPEDVASRMPYAAESAARSRLGLFSLRTNRRPRIFGTEPDNADLARLWDYVRLTQTNIDTLLREAKGSVCCTLFEKTQHGTKDDYGLGLNAIQINGRDIALPSWDELVSGKFPL